MVKTLVTGGLGFIGSNLVDALLAAGHDVVIIDNEATGHNHNSNAKVTTVIGDITVADDMAKLPKDVDYVVHLGAAISVAESMTNPEKYEKNNVEGSRAVLDWCVANNVKKIVSASTAAYYGNPEVLPCVETMNYAGISPYAETKYKMEKLHAEYNGKNGLVTGCTRFFNVYGPRQDPTSQYSGVISKFLDWAVKNETMRIFGDGENTRDFVYVADVAAALILFLEKGTGFNVYNVGRGQAIDLNELAATIQKVAGSTAGVEHAAPREGDIRYSFSDVSAIKTDLGFVAQTSLEEGLSKTHAWFKSQ